MAQVRNVRPGYAVIHPNRDKLICKVTKLLVVAVLLAAAALILIVTIGGWSKMQGMKPVDFLWAFLFVIMAIYVSRWSRGVLPISAGLGILLLGLAAIVALGAAGTTWSARNHTAFGHAHSLFGGTGLANSTLNAIVVLMIPVSVAVIIVSLIGFVQGWNVELEVPEDEARRRGSKPVARGPEAAAPA